MKICRGMSRFVLLVGPWAIKIPRFSHEEGARSFVRGMLANLNETNFWQISRHPALAEVLLCGPLGLILVMRRYDAPLGRRLTSDEMRRLPLINFDNNGQNVAVGQRGELVAIDYGNADCYLCLEAPHV